jgi:hypothetical protein
MNKPYVLILRDPFGAVVLKAEFVSEYVTDRWIEQTFPLALSDNHALVHVVEVKRL